MFTTFSCPNIFLLYGFKVDNTIVKYWLILFHGIFHMPWFYGLNLSNSMYEWFYAIHNGFGSRFNVMTRIMDLWVFVNDIGGPGW